LKKSSTISPKLVTESIEDKKLSKDARKHYLPIAQYQIYFKDKKSNYLKIIKILQNYFAVNPERLLEDKIFDLVNLTSSDISNPR
jgi:hypothetical protein